MFKIIVKSVVVLIIACIVGVIFRVVDITFFREKEVAVNEENIVTINDLIVENKTIEEVFKEDKVDNVEKVEEKSEKQTEVATNKVVTTKVEKKEKNDIIKKSDEQPKQEKVEEKVVEQPKENSKEQVIEQPKEDIKEQVVEQPKENVKEQVVEQPKTLKEEYKENTELINKIKNIIKNNETEDMKMYGYDIVVDSSIPEITNEFTFSEQRVINKLAWKFGTIRIYVRDYYCNGTYISTQCFII